jgi:hypothetical protein
MHDMHNPRYNVRQLVKELILLEDHLSCGEKQCRECIAKHALKTEAWLEEALTLGPDPLLYAELEALQDPIAGVVSRAIDGADCVRLREDVRALRRHVQSRILK